ncbi:hypothetical protein [Mycobacterium sp.]|uniref:hypothetical protein n=1 Tax=Mycobacterium sp. TaxID=1785 RepID=UPI0012706F9A|nr:hypothetical protein [Mycobacterium sp.]KAA8960261.1 MAG: hypothetical protein F6Q13_13905 [Mycobacterium sp.]
MRKIWPIVATGSPWLLDLVCNGGNAGLFFGTGGDGGAGTPGGAAGDGGAGGSATAPDGTATAGSVGADGKPGVSIG